MADNIDKNERFEQGMKTRRAVLGDAHVDRAQTVTTGFDQPFQQLITEADIREALLHVAIYAGVPAANHAFKTAKLALAGMKADSSRDEEETK